MSELHRKVLERVQYVAITSECDGCGLQSTETFENPHLPIITQLLNMNEELASALEKAGGAGPLVGYAFDANHQHESLIKEMKLRRKVCLEALTSNQAQMEKLAGGGK